MLCKEIIDRIEEAYPREYALDWDNTGLLVGRDDKEVRRIYLALDATDEVIDAAVKKGADMLVTHHPLIFTGLKRVTNQDFVGARILTLLRQDISYYAMHTNYDVKGMASSACDRLGLEGSEVLEVTARDPGGREEGIGRVADMEPVSLKELCERVKKAFHLPAVRVAGSPGTYVKRAALCPGSGKSVIGAALEKGADVLITGDIGHHEGIDAAAQGLMIIDAGHYGMEHIFMEDMTEYLKRRIPEVEAVAAEVSHPFLFL